MQGDDDDDASGTKFGDGARWILRAACTEEQIIMSLILAFCARKSYAELGILSALDPLATVDRYSIGPLY